MAGRPLLRRGSQKTCLKAYLLVVTVKPQADEMYPISVGLFILVP
jgi:hypothetical protein